MALKSVYWKGAGAISETLDVDEAIMIHEVRLHLGAAGGASENFSVQLDSRLGSEYDVVFSATDMNALTDKHWQPTRPVYVHSDDTVDFTYTNTNSQTWGLEVVFA
jgi:hypothetical protein